MTDQDTNLCPYEGPGQWFAYEAAIYEGQGDVIQFERADALARACKIRCINWHRFKAATEVLCQEYSAILRAGRAK